MTETQKMSSEEQQQLVEDVQLPLQQIMASLRGKSPRLQSFILGNVLAMHLITQPSKLRDPTLNAIISVMMASIPMHERAVFNGKLHPEDRDHERNDKN
jgi:hypothetical protein